MISFLDDSFCLLSILRRAHHESRKEEEIPPSLPGDMFVVRLMVEQADTGSIFPLKMLVPFGSWGCVILGCRDVWLVPSQCSSMTLLSSQFRNRTFPIVLARLPAGFCSTTLASFPSTPSHETTKGQKRRRWYRQTWRYFFFYSRSWERRTAPDFRCV